MYSDVGYECVKEVKVPLKLKKRGRGGWQLPGSFSLLPLSENV